MTTYFRPGSVDPDEERDPVPAPTVVYFPQNDVYLKGQDDWSRSPPDLWHEFAQIQKPGDILLSHVTALNITQNVDVSVDEIVPRLHGHPSFVPPPEWLVRRKSSVATHSTAATTHLMDSGSKAPDSDQFSKLARELTYSTDDALRTIAHRRPHTGHEQPHLHHTRDFWEHLDVMAQFWDTSLDNYSTTAKSAPPSPTQTRPKLMKLNFFSAEKSHTAAGKHKKDRRHANAQTYSGRRIGSGDKMPEHYRVDMVRALVRCVAHAFKCSLVIPRFAPKLQVKTMLIPVTHSGVVWQTPSDKHLARQGFQEGPLLGIQCRNETGFMNASRSSVIDVARETAALLQLAQDRSREGKPPVIPGQGQWWTTQRRWGGGEGGEFGEAEQKALEERGSKSPTPQRRASYPSYGSLPGGKTEEQTWKELRPGKSLWQPRTIYRSVGKNQEARTDSVFLISSIYHHIAIVRLDVHVKYLEYLSEGRVGPIQQGDSNWYKPTVSRTQWYDMFDPQDRAEVLRAIWGIMAWETRPSSNARPVSRRQPSEGASGLFSMAFRKKKHNDGQSLQPQRSHSIG